MPRKLVEQIAAKHDWDPRSAGWQWVQRGDPGFDFGRGEYRRSGRGAQPSFALYRIDRSDGRRYVPVPLGAEYAYDVMRSPPSRSASAPGRGAELAQQPHGSVLPENGVATLLERTESLLCATKPTRISAANGAHPAAPVPGSSCCEPLSKAMGMAGLRFGYALAHPDVAREIAKAKLPYNVNAITLAAAEVMLKHSAEFAARAKAIAQERDRFLGLLGSLTGLHPFPSKANFVLVRCDRVPARKVFRRLVEEHGILVRDMSSGSGLAECLRISVGTAEDTDAVVTALSTILAD